MKPILLSLLLLGGCLSKSQLIHELKQDDAIISLQKAVLGQQANPVENWRGGLGFEFKLPDGPYVCEICHRKFEKHVFSTCAVYHGPNGCCHYNEKEIDSDEEFLRKGREDVERMKGIRE